ncbi:MAG: dephospho-CoA kinase [Myxococcales bacterium]|nr:dephospho-CoA kinase [Myxococcales bacterium]
MEVYGLTGGIGSGKSTVANMLEEYGIPVVSADELSRMVVAPGSEGLADVVEAFGSEVLDERGDLDRKKMGKIVFTTPERRRQLEAILHPRIRERYEQVLDALEKAGHPVMVYEVPLLFEKKLDQQDEMTGVILVTATADTRIARVKSRDSLTTDDVLARMRVQMPEEEKRARANYIIHNDGDVDDLRREVEHLISRYLRLAPRDEHAALEEIEEVEPLSEAEIDTLAPEPEDDDEPAVLDDAEEASPSPENLEIELQSAGESAPPAGSGLEVELTPGSDGTAAAARKATAPRVQIPGVVKPPAAAPPSTVVTLPPVAAPPPAAADDATAGTRPRPPRPRVSTVPQMSVPTINPNAPAPPDEPGIPSDDDDEDPS